MLRPVWLIAAAIQLSQPQMSAATATSYATVVQQEAKKRHFDPFSLVAIIHFESRWASGAVSPNGEDFGLSQIRARFIGACRKDEDPVFNPSPECKAIKASLLEPSYNLRFASGRITASRNFCRRKVGKVTYHGWLAAWQGSHKWGKWCQRNRHTTLRIKYRDKLAKMAEMKELTLRNKRPKQRHDVRLRKK